MWVGVCNEAGGEFREGIEGTETDGVTAGDSVGGAGGSICMTGAGERGMSWTAGRDAESAVRMKWVGKEDFGRMDQYPESKSEGPVEVGICLDPKKDQLKEEEKSTRKQTLSAP